MQEPSSSRPVQTLRDADIATATTARALRMVLAIALDRAAVSACLGGASAHDGALWPSTLYAWAAETAARSPLVWRRCEIALDDALAPWLTAYERASVARIAEALSPPETAAALAGHEIAAALWALIRRRERGLTLVTERLTMEAELLVTRACVGHAAIPHEPGPPRPRPASRSPIDER